MKSLDKSNLFGPEYEEVIVKSVINRALTQSDPESIHEIYKRIKHLEALPDDDVSLSTPELIYTLLGGKIEVDFSHQEAEYEKYVKSHQTTQQPKAQSILDSEGGLLTAESFGEQISKSNKTISRLFTQNKIIGIQKTPGATQPRFYPAWQIHDDAVYSVIAQIIKIFDSSGTDVLRFCLLPAPELNGERPLDYIRAFKDEQVIALAEQRNNQPSGVQVLHG